MPFLAARLRCLKRNLLVFLGFGFSCGARGRTFESCRVRQEIRAPSCTCARGLCPLRGARVFGAAGVLFGAAKIRARLERSAGRVCITCSMATSARTTLATVLVAVTTLLAVATPEARASQITGFNSLFIGHSFFRPFADGMPFHAAQAGVVGHTQSVVFAGGANGAPQALWEDAAKRAEIQAVLDGGDVELFGMTYHGAYPTTEGYENWIDYALAQNPNTRFALALPWGTNPESTSAVAYASDWHLAHSTGWHGLLVDALRALYPGVEFFCIPYGHSALELRLLFADGNLADVDFLVSATGDAIYSDSFGHADDILIDLGRLVWLNAIYGVDLTTYAYDPGYIADLKGIAQLIMDDHDAAYGEPTPVPAMPPWGMAFLATLFLAVGVWSIHHVAPKSLEPQFSR